MIDDHVIRLTIPIRRRRRAKISGHTLVIAVASATAGVAAAASAAAASPAIRQHFALVILLQVLPYFGVAMLVVGNNDFARVGRGDACLAIELSRQIALPIFLILAYVLDAERVSVMHQERLTALAQHELQFTMRPFIAGCYCFRCSLLFTATNNGDLMCVVWRYG